MLSLSRIDHHFDLMSSMADRNGADFTEAMQLGALSPESFRSAVLSCTGCSNPEGCEAHLDSGETGFPPFCRNAGMMAALAKAG